MPDQNVLNADSESFDKKADFDYTPSNWPSRLHPKWSSQEMLSHYCTETSNGASYVYGTLANQITTVKYGEGNCEELDIVSPLHTASSTGCSLLVFIHGGYWQEGHFRSNSMHLARPIVEAGHYFAAIGHLDSETQLPLVSIIDQVVRAINELSDFAAAHNISSIVLSGHSAGAHLVAMVITSTRVNHNSKALIKGVVLLSGVYDISSLMNTSIIIPELGITNRAVAQKLSPIHTIDSERIVLENLSKVIIGYGEDESPMFKSQSTQYMKKLLGFGLCCQAFVGLAKDHFSLIVDAHMPEDALAKELVAMLDQLTDST